MRCSGIFSVATLLLLSATPAAAAGNAVTDTEALAKAFKAVKALPDDGSPLSAADKKANAGTFAALDGYFAWEQLTQASIEPHKAGFSKTQMAEFNTALRETIRLVAYPGSGTFFQKAKYKLKKAKSKGGLQNVDMFAELVEEDLETTVTFHWRNVDGKLRVVDVSFDGASLVADYRNQFGRIIKKHGVDGLLERLRKKLAEERAAGVV